MLKTIYIITIFLVASPYVMAYEYKSATEDDIKKLFEETKAKPGIEFTRDPYKITIRIPSKFITESVFEHMTYYFTDTGHFSHPSVVIERQVTKIERGQPSTVTDRELVSMTTREREYIEKWVRVIEKPYNSIKRMKQEVDPRSICGTDSLQSRPQDSVKCYEKVAKNNPDSVTAQFFLGIAYIHTGDELSTRKQYEILKKQSLYDTTDFVIFGIPIMKPKWLDYYKKDKIRVDRISEAQQLLDSLGYETGILVGAIVPKLEAAIRTFQRNANLPVNGEVTEPLLEKLRTWKK